MTVQDFDAHTQRDMIQHHVVAAVAGIGDDRLVFKGGTLLRVCVFNNYRWSEDLDFDWAGSPERFRALVGASVAKAASSLGIPTLTTEDAGAVNVNIVAPEMPGPIRAEATVLAERDDSVPTQRWPINPRWGTTADTAPIRGYTATAVAADKLRCLARRSAPRDIYDLDQLAQSPQVDLPVAWNLYAANYNDPAREYGRRNHPADIRSTYLGRRDHIATAWHQLQQQGQTPPKPTSTRPSTESTATSPNYATPGPTACHQENCTDYYNNTSNNNKSISAHDTTHGAATGACRGKPPADTSDTVS